MKIVKAMNRKEMAEYGAIFSDDRKHRFALWRDWNIPHVFSPNYSATETVMFIGLNPSTADERNDDPTIRRCIGYAKDWGYNKFVMMNIFALVSTDPKALVNATHPMQKENNKYLIKQGEQADIIIAAWGTFPEAKKRGAEVAKMFEGKLHCLKKTKHGYPSHPLYLRKDLEPIPYP